MCNLSCDDILILFILHEDRDDVDKLFDVFDSLCVQGDDSLDNMCVFKGRLVQRYIKRILTIKFLLKYMGKRYLQCLNPKSYIRNSKTKIRLKTESIKCF